MRKKKKYLLIPLIVLLCLAVLYFGSEAIAIYRLGLKKVCVSKMNLPSRSEIKEEYLDYIYVPKAYINENVLIKKEDILGKYVRLSSAVPKGSLFYKDALDSLDEMADGLHLILNDDEISYDLFYKDVKANPGHLLKGMNVDLYLTINRKEVMSDLLISGARIIGLYDVNNKEIKNINDSSLGIITLAIKKEMVPYLNKAIVIGDVSLLVANDLYEDKQMYMNTSSAIFEMLKW